jgi:hypothetical protein
METLLYNKINKVIKDDISYLKSFQIGSGKVESIVKYLLENETTYTAMKENLDKYIERLTNLDRMLNINILKDKDSDYFNITNIFDENSVFQKFIQKYKDFLEKQLWNKERIILDDDESNPTKYDIFFNIDNKLFTDQIKDFNDKLKILYGPYINDSEKSLKKNIIQNINKVDEIIEISKKFNEYIQEKKNEINKILLINYNINDLKIIDNLPENENFWISFDLIKLDQDSALDFKSLKQIESDIKTISDNIKINENINKLYEINVFKIKNPNLTDLTDLLNIDEVINLKSFGQSGGILDNKYYTFDSDLQVSDYIKKIEYLFELLDNIFNDFEYMKEIHYRYNFYIAYLYLIIRESAKNIKMEMYQYISKNKLLLYQKVFSNIKKQIVNIQQSNNVLEFFNKYHYITIKKLNELIIFILPNLNDTNYVNINKCTGNIYYDFILFNHFRQIIINLSKSKDKNILGLTDDEIKFL